MDLGTFLSTSAAAPEPYQEDVASFLDLAVPPRSLASDGTAVLEKVSESGDELNAAHASREEPEFRPPLRSALTSALTSALEAVMPASSPSKPPSSPRPDEPSSPSDPKSTEILRKAAAAAAEASQVAAKGSSPSSPIKPSQDGDTSPKLQVSRTTEGLFRLGTALGFASSPSGPSPVSSPRPVKEGLMRAWTRGMSSWAVGKKPESAVPVDKYTSNRTFREALVDGDTKLVKGSFLLKTWGGAFAKPAVEVEEEEEEPDSAAYYRGGRKNTRDPGRKSFWACEDFSLSTIDGDDELPSRQEAERFPGLAADFFWEADELMEKMDAGEACIIAISWCWLTREHPDPDSVQIQLFCQVLRRFLDSNPVTDVAVFIDWCCLYQKPRSGDMERSFSRGLQNYHVWYAHAGTRVWMMTQSPPMTELDAPYSGCAWPCLERTLSGSMVKKAAFLLDLGLLDDTCSDWRKIVETCKPRRRPPVLPEAFTHDIAKKLVFEGQPGIEVASRLYAEAFADVIGAAVELSFQELGWEEQEGKQLAALLPRCDRLRKVALYGNRMGPESASEFAKVLPKCPALEELWLVNNPIAKSLKLEGARNALIEAWQSAGKAPDGLHF